MDGGSVGRSVRIRESGTAAAAACWMASVSVQIRESISAVVWIAGASGNRKLILEWKISQSVFWMRGMVI